MLALGLHHAREINRIPTYMFVFVASCKYSQVSLSLSLTLYIYIHIYIYTYICIGALMYLRSFGEKSLYIHVASIHSMVMVAVMSRFIGLGRPSLHEYVVS